LRSLDSIITRFESGILIPNLSWIKIPNVLNKLFDNFGDDK